MIDADFQFLAAFLKGASGLVLSPDKAYLVESRLQPIARRHGLTSVDQLVARLRVPPSVELRREIVEAMTINETSFFRDTKPFDILRTTVLPALMAARAQRRHLRIWCAAASSGQEPYSVAMLLHDEPRLHGWRIDLVGTDIDTAILEKAATGRYSKFEVQRGLPIQTLLKHFTKISEDCWELNAAVRNRVTFRQANLLEDFSVLGGFDVILCRNVLIYFDVATKGAILNRMHRLVADDGYLFLGGAETVLGITNRFSLSPGYRGLYTKTVAAASCAA